MCQVSGFCDFTDDFLTKEPYWIPLLKEMETILSARGQSGYERFITQHTAFSNAHSQNQYAICFDGTIYNTKELIPHLRKAGYNFDSSSDAEIVLSAYMYYGPEFVKKLNGVFAFAIWNTSLETLLLYRDPAGTKPLFYSLQENTLIFGSEPKALFVHPKVTPRINTNSLQEVLGLGPAHTPGNGVFVGIKEVLPGHYMTFSRFGFLDHTYWDLKAMPHTDTYPETVEKVSVLLRDAIKLQMTSDTPVCTFLSGGIDSSIVTAIASEHLQNKGETLSTFSFDFEENNQYFQSNAFQPERDTPYVNIMGQRYPTHHVFLECPQSALFDLLEASVDLRDMPGMTDIDASLLYFCSLVAKQNKVALTGECADEIFGGYPWFYRENLLNTDDFPWSFDTTARCVFLDEDLTKQLELKEYAHSRYLDTIKKTPLLEGESREQSRHREISYLNIKWFMQTLLDRMDRAGMHSGLNARVPFADLRIMEYLYNVPWSMKYRDGVEKSLLRDAARDLLPDSILHRKKSPYPKTYHLAYEKRLVERFTAIVENPNAPIAPLIDKQKALSFMSSHKELGKPWYGQLMAGPQLLAYFIQLNYWMEKYKLSI